MQVVFIDPRTSVLNFDTTWSSYLPHNQNLVNSVIREQFFPLYTNRDSHQDIKSKSENMSIITKTEMCDNTPASLPPLSFQALIGDMKRIESLSNEKIMALERRLQAAEDEAKVLGKQNEELKSSLAAKERDCKLYYDQYQNIAAEFEEFKSKAASEAKPAMMKNADEEEGEIEPAIIIFDTDTETEESHEETTLFTSPELFLEPATLEKPIPAANSTELPALSQSEDSEKVLEKTSTNSNITTAKIGSEAISENEMPKTSSAKKPKMEKTKRPIAVARKRARSESHVKSGGPTKKTCYTPKSTQKPTHFKCRYCSGKSFDTIEEFREHIKQNHSERIHLCDICPYSDTSGNLPRHKERVHTVAYGSGNDCELCKISFPTKRQLGFHLGVYH